MTRGLGDGLTQAIELILTPLAFAAVGLLLDRVLGTAPVLTWVLAGFGVVGAFVVAFFRYEARIAAEEAARTARQGKPWERR